MKLLIKILFVTLIAYLPMILTAQPVGALGVETIYGEVTIGALNPWGNIHFIADEDTDRFYFNKPIWTSGGQIGSYDTNLSLRTHTTTRMTILKSNGNVGIGLGNPEQRLHIRGVMRSSYRQKLSDYIEVGHGGANSYINHNGVGRMDFRFALQNKMSLTNEGKLVIGDADVLTTPGNYSLYVENGILTERVKVASKDDPIEWADYVFESDYDLNTTEEVETFIKENKHLPNVPSAKEVGEKGVDIVEMDATLLRQIEELWLHVIELKKDNKALNQDNEELKKEVQILKSRK